MGAALLLALAAAGPTPLGSIWRGAGGAVVVTPCVHDSEHDGWCRGVAVRAGGRTVQLGTAYERVRLLWRRARGQAGPDAMVFGDSGGSGGFGDLFAVTLAPRLAVVRIGGERMEGVAAKPGPGPLRVDLPFDLEFFNDAPHAGAIVARLPVRWAGAGWALDRAALLRPIAPDELSFRRLALAEDLSRWAAAEDRSPTGPLYPYTSDGRGGTLVTGQALVELILAGRAEVGHAMLLDGWPRDEHGRVRGGADAFWADLCRAVVRQPLWRRFGLGSLPQAALVEAAAH